MSHKASSWLADIDPDVINNGAFRVLFHLCDAHNSKRERETACFPSQELLRKVTGLSNGGLNNALNAIEKAGLMRRRRTRNSDGTKGPTYYILGCDGPIEQQPTPESGDGTISKNEAQPSPNSGMNHLQWSGDKPVIEPVKEPCAAEPAHTNGFDFEGFFAAFARAYPRLGSLEETESALREAIAAGSDPKDILAGARAYASEQKGNSPQYVAYSQNWIAAGRWRQHVSSAANSDDSRKVLELRAADIRAGRPWVRAGIKPSQAGECIAAGLVTIEECQAAGIHV